VPLASQGTQAWDRLAFVNNNPVNGSDPSGHMRVEEPGSKRGCSSNPGYCEYAKVHPVEPIITSYSAIVTRGSRIVEDEDVIPYIEGTRYLNKFLGTLGTIENSIQNSRPFYKQIKYIASLNNVEYGIDGALQLYDDRYKELFIGQRIFRAGVVSGESLIIDILSTTVGGSVGLGLQLSAPEAPGIAFGVGYIIGTYSTSYILTNLANSINPSVFYYSGLGQ
jgi:hypothetical protein